MPPQSNPTGLASYRLPLCSAPPPPPPTRIKFLTQEPLLHIPHNEAGGLRNKSGLEAWPEQVENWTTAFLFSSLPSHLLTGNKKAVLGVGEMAWQERALTVLAKVLGSVPRNNASAHNYPSLWVQGIQHPPMTSLDTRHICGACAHMWYMYTPAWKMFKHKK